MTTHRTADRPDIAHPATPHGAASRDSDRRPLDRFDPALIEAALPAFLEAMRWHDGGGWITYKPLARGCRWEELVKGLGSFLDLYLELVKADVDRRLAELERNHDYRPPEVRGG